MSDAAHMFSDFGTFAISMIALYVAKKKANHKKTFGFYRAGRKHTIGVSINLYDFLYS